MMNQTYHTHEEIASIPDRLRRLRHSKGLMQREVARIAGVSRSVYIDIECGVTQHLPECFLENLSPFYGVPPTDFLDEYNRFLYDGQAQRIIAYRRKLGMGRKPFCSLENLSPFYGVPPTDFLDEYNRFLYDGQAQRIIAYRRKLGMGRKPFCSYMGIPLSSLRGWEDGKKEVSRKSWETYFKRRA